MKGRDRSFWVGPELSGKGFMVKRIAGWIVLVPLCVVLVMFALANRHAVVVNFNPFMLNTPADANGAGGVPLFLVLFLVLLIGVLAGGVASWLAQGQVRADKRHWRKEAYRLSQEAEALRKAAGQGASNRALLEVDEFVDNP